MNSGELPAALRRPVVSRKEVKLSSSRAERFMYDNLGDLFAILVTTEHLETAYVRDAVPADEYARACTKLIAQYKAAKVGLKDTVPDIAKFMEDFDVQTPSAYKRLEISGVPATVEYGGGDSGIGKPAELHVAAAVQHFITTMDSLKLEMVAVDDLHPSLIDLMDSLQKVSGFSNDHVSKVKVNHWLVVMNSMRASDELDPDQVRQLLFDLETAYNAFVRHLDK